ncbi:hypothetical protein [Acidisphaera sp. S103]|uniref:hypothetical protein n=1 Tax=Acidisphaera sp. S103 TaxID=1747223 RepID=UPI00131AFA4F|nr:hypothetical protein [Acidisphaera sp. S103]
MVTVAHAADIPPTFSQRLDRGAITDTKNGLMDPFETSPDGVVPKMATLQPILIRTFDRAFD